MKLFKSNLSRYIFFLLIIILYSFNALAMADTFIEIKSVYDGYLEYIKYENHGNVEKVTLSDLIIFKQYIKKEYPSYGTIYRNKPDFKLLLLQKGMAQLKNYEIAPTIYKNAQDEAKKQGAGGWPAPAPAPAKVEIKKDVKPTELNKPSTDNNLSSTKPGRSILDYLSYIISLIINVIVSFWKWIIILSALGISSFIFNKFYSNILNKINERRIHVLLIGDEYAGKTALWLRLDDPSIPQEKIKEISPSVKEEKVNIKPIPWGKLELIPDITDIAGRTPSQIWDKFVKSSSHVVIFVLAPTIKQDRLSHDLKLDDDERDYVNIQFGLVKGIIQGGLRSSVTKKPKVIIFFINKFDLFSDNSPDDTSTVNANSFYNETFKTHIDISKKIGKELKIPVHIVIGSVLRNWNCQKIMDLIKHDLYPKSKRK